MPHVEFAFLNLHSWYSSTGGVPSVSELVDRLASLGYRSAALTDYCSLAGIPEFVELCRSRNIKPIAGVELPVELLGGESRIVDRLLLLAEDDFGYSNLSRLTTVYLAKASDLREKVSARGQAPCVTLDDLQEFVRGVFVLTGLRDASVYRFLSEGNREMALKCVSQLLAVFPSQNVYLAVPSPMYAAAAGSVSREKRIRPVACPSVYYLTPPDELAYLYLCGAQCPSSFSLENAGQSGELRHLARKEEVAEFYRGNVALLAASIELAERCRALAGSFRPRFPSIPMPKGQVPSSYIQDAAARELMQLYPEQRRELNQRVGKEVDKFAEAGLLEKFVLLHSLLNYCRQRGVTMGVGNPELVTSLTAFALGLTQVDPIFFRLNFAGISSKLAADNAAECFAIDLPIEAAAIVAEFFQHEFWSEDNRAAGRLCARVGRYCALSRHVLIRQLLAWMGIGGDEAHLVDVSERDGIRPFSSFVKSPFTTITLPNVQVANFVLSRLLGRPVEFYYSENELAISGTRLDSLTPLLSLDGQAVTQMSGDALKILRVPRLVLSSSPQLRILDTAVRWIREELDEPDFVVSRKPLDDGRTYELLRRGLTLGIVPFESMGMRHRLRRDAPRTFHGLLKVRAAEAAATNEEGDIQHFITECLLGYRLAYVKAHYPSFFFAALFSRMAVSEQSRALAPYLREAREMGIKVLGPDINRSSFQFSIERNAVRCGLCLVKGVGERTYREINSARAQGEFQDLLDLRRRTERRIVHSAVLQNLVRAGALDCFDLNRHQLLAMVEQLSQIEIEDYTTVLSEEFELQAPDVDPPTPRELANLELAATDLTISVDLLDVYSQVVKRSGALRFGALNRRAVGCDVALVGYINHVDSKPTLENNTEIYYVDFDGYPVTLPAKVKQAYASAISSNEPVLMIGTVLLDAGRDLTVRASALYTMDEVEFLGGAVRKMTLNLEAENFQTMRLLYSLFRKFSSGSTLVEVGKTPPHSSCRLLAWLLSRRKVFFCPPLYHQLRKMLAENQLEMTFTNEMARQHAMHLLSSHRHIKNVM
ncbi:MAG: PHP domain-containing protein [Candidatus Sumerlaeaceae bacterium]|nr:PHP domain-containing protein [Candidatus Sumerlaeaceae bacterium]